MTLSRSVHSEQRRSTIIASCAFASQRSGCKKDDPQMGHASGTTDATLRMRPGRKCVVSG